jgi:hypothetical protein
MCDLQAQDQERIAHHLMKVNEGGKNGNEREYSLDELVKAMRDEL